MSIRLGIRGRLLAVVAVAVLASAIALVVASNLVLSARLDGVVNDVLRAQAAARLGSLSTVNGKVRVGEAPDDAAPDSMVWIYAGSTLLEGPVNENSTLRNAADALAQTGYGARTISTPHDRLLAVPAEVGGRRIATVVVGVSLAPYERTRREAMVTSIELALALALVSLALAAWSLRAVLRPITRMTTDAAEWSEHDLERRFELGPARDELTRLAATFDALFDRVAAGMRGERRFSDELSHELRTPLTQITSHAQLLRDTPGMPDEALGDVESVLASAYRMADVIDTLLAAARADARANPGTANAAAIVEQVVAAARTAAIDRGVELSIKQTTSTVGRVAAEGALLERMVMPLIDNACRMARSCVTVEVSRSANHAEISVTDDGPGVLAEECAAIFEPGRRGSAGIATHDGSGLGLALARRLARSVGGEVTLDAEHKGGARFILRVPLA